MVFKAKKFFLGGVTALAQSFCLFTAYSYEINFQALVNHKEFTLERSNLGPKLFLERGRREGYTFERVGDLWQANLTGGHTFILNEYENSGHTHLVLMEARREKHRYYAWSVRNNGTEVKPHNLNDFTHLVASDSIDSTAGSTFEYRKVLPVPYTDKFLTFSNLGTDYLRCHYLGKLMGRSYSEETCLKYQRMQSGLTFLSAHSINNARCEKYVYNQSLSFDQVVKNERSFISCFQLTSDLERSCLISSLESEVSLLQCFSQKFTLSTKSFVSFDCDEDDVSCLYGDFLKSELTRQTHFELDYEDLETGLNFKLRLPFDQSAKMAVGNCYYQFLGSRPARSQLELLAHEAFNSCLSAYKEGQRESHFNNAYLPKWLVESFSRHHFEIIPGQPFDKQSHSLSYWLGRTFNFKDIDSHFDLPLLGHERSSLGHHYQAYARYLLKRGYFEYLKQRQAHDQDVWRAPASVSP